MAQPHVLHVLQPLMSPKVEKERIFSTPGQVYV